MRADEVVEEDEHGNEVVGRSERGKPLFGFVPCLKLLVKALYKVVGNIIVETLHTDMLDPMQRLNGHLVGKIAVANNGLRSPNGVNEYREGKGRGPPLLRARGKGSKKRGSLGRVRQREEF